MSKIIEWADELQSGKYEQGKGLLKSDGRYCCLGVLCEAVLDLPSVGNDGLVGFYVQEGEEERFESLPSSIKTKYSLGKSITQKEADLINSTTTIIVSPYMSREITLITLNDSGVPFYAIGMLIKLLGWGEGNE